jgi:hypothetical protein
MTAHKLAAVNDTNLFHLAQDTLHSDLSQRAAS